MPQTRQHIPCERRLYQNLPEVTVEAVRAGKIICDQNKQKQFSIGWEEL